VIDLELTRARYGAMYATPSLVKAAPKFHGRLIEEYAPMIPSPHRDETLWCGIPVVINPYLPSDVAVMLDAQGEIVAVVQC
jgi:hypothetical protein